MDFDGFTIFGVLVAVGQAELAFNQVTAVAANVVKMLARFIAEFVDTGPWRGVFFRWRRGGEASTDVSVFGEDLVAPGGGCGDVGPFGQVFGVTFGARNKRGRRRSRWAALATTTGGVEGAEQVFFFDTADQILTLRQERDRGGDCFE